MTQNTTHMKAVERQGYRAGHRPHIVMINRWQERYAEYGRYLDHKRYQVSYVTTAVGLASVPPVAGATSPGGRHRRPRRCACGRP